MATEDAANILSPLLKKSLFWKGMMIATWMYGFKHDSEEPTKQANRTCYNK